MIEWIHILATKRTWTILPNKKLRNCSKPKWYHLQIQGIPNRTSPPSSPPQSCNQPLYVWFVGTNWLSVFLQCHDVARVKTNASHSHQIIDYRLVLGCRRTTLWIHDASKPYSSSGSDLTKWKQVWLLRTSSGNYVAIFSTLCQWLTLDSVADLRSRNHEIEGSIFFLDFSVQWQN